MKGNNTYTIVEASEKLGVAVVTIRRYVESGKIKAKKVFGKWRIPKQELDKFDY